MLRCCVGIDLRLHDLIRQKLCKLNAISQVLLALFSYCHATNINQLVKYTSPI
ncbi:hypothetical protein MTBPR1_20276 [Candidatus Terasakiella magnetica]|uniref:Uncharacterized protein n=1 Tax=Candidatus Terasakiella magnetica TaxID=1867952 RepID=A0A1C3RGQ6_9PROT|nr:hypothetical protein MTBPR1_20276 [Candidatus Terasakiella magnetica]